MNRYIVTSGWHGHDNLDVASEHAEDACRKTGIEVALYKRVGTFVPQGPRWIQDVRDEEHDK